MTSKPIDELYIRQLIRYALKEGKLFELLVSEEGKRLWKRNKHKMKQWVEEEMRNVFGQNKAAVNH